MSCCPVYRGFTNPLLPGFGDGYAAARSTLMVNGRYFFGVMRQVVVLCFTPTTLNTVVERRG